MKKLREYTCMHCLHSGIQANTVDEEVSVGKVNLGLCIEPDAGL